MFLEEMSAIFRECNNIRKNSYQRYREDRLVYIQHHKNLWDKVDHNADQCILAGKYNDLKKKSHTKSVVFLGKKLETCNEILPLKPNT